MYEITLPINEYIEVYELCKKHNIDGGFIPRDICISNLNLLASFKCDKELLEKIMYFMPEGYLKQKLQSKIDFFIMADEW